MKRLWAWVKSWFAPSQTEPVIEETPVIESDTVCRLEPVLRSILKT